MFPKIGGKNPKWMVKIMENPIRMDDLWVPLFLETPTSCYFPKDCLTCRLQCWECFKVLGLVGDESGKCFWGHWEVGNRFQPPKMDGGSPVGEDELNLDDKIFQPRLTCDANSKH